MTPERFRALLEGSLAQWQVQVALSFEADSYRCGVGDGGHIATVSYLETGVGTVWRIEVPGRTPRIHRSVVPALTTLRDILCPHRPGGRALFVAPPGESS